MEDSEHWLVFSHCYNMDGRAASQLIKPRVAELSKRGIKCTVISAPNGANDPSVFKHSRVFSCFPAGLKFELRHWIRREIQSKTLQRILLSLNSILLSPFAIIERILMPLESQWSWFFGAFLCGIFSTSKARNPINLIYSTGGPVGGHFASIFLSKIFRTPCVCEIQDPLFFDSPEWKPKGRSKLLYRMIEKYICKNASAVIFLTQTAKKKALARTKIKPCKFHCIYQGALTLSTISNDLVKTPKAKLKIAHFGSLAGARNLNAMFLALLSVFDKHPHLRDYIQLYLYGNLDEKVINSIEEFPFKEIVSVEGLVSHDLATKRMQEVDALLLIQDDSYVALETIPSKFYEYLHSGKPVFALVHNAELIQMLKSFSCYVAEIIKPESIEDCLLQFLSDFNQKSLLVPRGEFPKQIESVRILQRISEALKSKYAS
jgi:glycosyltransferase involved in cell wall biosynthesis